MSRILLVLKYWRIFNFWNLIRDFINSNGYSCLSIVVYEEIINFNGFFYYFSRVYHFIGIRRCCSPNSVIYYLVTAKCQSFCKLLCRTVLSPFLLWTLWLLDIFFFFPVQYDKDFKFTMKDPALWLLSWLSKAKWWTAEEVKGFNGDAAKLKGIRIKLLKKWRRKAPKPNQKQ